MDVNRAWKELFSSDAYKRQSQELRIEKKMNETKLESAIKEGNAEKVRRLINTQLVDVNTNKCLIEAVIWGHNNDVVKIFIDAGADIDTQYGGKYSVSLIRGRTPLSFAAASGIKEVVKTLLDSGIDPNMPDIYGETSLHTAVQKQRIDPDILKLLLDYGANPNMTDKKGGENDGEQVFCTRYLMVISDR